MRDLISIIIPTYNRASSIQRCLDSALAQTHKNVEIVVIDDGSTDDTRAVIKSRYGDEPRVHYIHQVNQGVTAARNTGLRACQGDFIALLDSDDYWEPWKLSLQLAVLTRFAEAGMVWTDMRAVDASGKVIAETYLRKMYSCYEYFSLSEMFSRSQQVRDIFPEVANDAKVYIGSIYRNMFMGNLVHTSTVLLTRERFETVREFDPTFQVSGEDYDFHFRACRAGPVAFIDMPTVFYQVGAEDQLTSARLSRHVAANALATIEKAYANTTSRINLPADMIKRRFAEVHAWLGETQLGEGDRRRARENFWHSLRYSPWQTRTARLLALACCPDKLGQWLRSVYRRLRNRQAVSYSGTA